MYHTSQYGRLSEILSHPVLGLATWLALTNGTSINMKQAEAE